MKLFFSKPHNWFLIAIPVFYLVGLIYSGNSAIDIQLHDTMFVIDIMHICLIHCLFFLIWSIIHIGILKFQPSRIVSLVHFSTTFAIPFVAMVLTIYAVNRPPRYTTYANIESLNDNNTTSDILFWAILVFILAQILFFFYLLFLLLKPLFKSNI